MADPKRRPGRPTTTGTTPTRSLRLGPVWDQAKAKAEQTGETITAVVGRLLSTYVQEDIVTTTTEYGTWTNVENSSVSVEDSVAVALGEFAGDYDIGAVVSDYREAINAALPDGVSLNGDQFYGPAHAADFDGYPVNDEDGRLDIKAIVDSIDFWAIAAKHDTSA